MQPIRSWTRIDNSFDVQWNNQTNVRTYLPTYIYTYIYICISLGTNLAACRNALKKSRLQSELMLRGLFYIDKQTILYTYVYICMYNMISTFLLLCGNNWTFWEMCARLHPYRAYLTHYIRCLFALYAAWVITLGLFNTNIYACLSVYPHVVMHIFLCLVYFEFKLLLLQNHLHLHTKVLHYSFEH